MSLERGNVRLSREEQETIINGNAASQSWDVCTADPRIIRRMEKQGYKPDERENPWGYVSFTVPFDRVRILRPEKRKLTAEQRESRMRALATAREKRFSSVN